MAELGKGPLKVVSNVLRCGACDAHLPSKAAGSTITASYDGPVLVGVAIVTSRSTIHDCTGELNPRRGGRDGHEVHS